MSTTLCLDWHPSNSILAAGGTDFKCRIFGAHLKDVDGQIISTLPWAAKITPAECLAEFSAQNHGWVHSCSFNLSGDLLAYAAHDSTIYVANSKQNPIA
jgi:actin related protein 2/3 complex subunit 1A/1B